MSDIRLLVLAGGFGTRLRSVVSDVPKPLAPVCGRPFIAYLADSWVEQGVSELVFLLHHEAGQMRDYLEQCRAGWRSRGCELNLLTEAQPLGTGGAVMHAVRQLSLQEPFLVANADTWLGSGVRQVAAAPAPAMAVITVADSDRYGGVVLEQDRITGFEEKKTGSPACWINAGLYNLHPGLFDGRDESAFSLERDIFPALAGRGELRAVPLQTEFIDIGVPEDYFRFNNWLESGKTVEL